LKDQYDANTSKNGNERISFAKTSTTIGLPYMLSVQRESFDSLLLFDTRENFRLEFVEYN